MSSPYNTRRKRKTAGADPEWNPPATKRSSHSLDLSTASSGPAAGSGCSAPSSSSGLKGIQQNNTGGGRSDGGKQKQTDIDVDTVGQGFEEDAASEATDSDFGDFDDQGSVVEVGERYPRLAVDPVVKEEPEDDPIAGPAVNAGIAANEDLENEDFLPPGIVITEILAGELLLYFFEQRNKPTFFEIFSQDDLDRMPVRMPVPLLHIPY